MPAQKRHKTRYAGVYYIQGKAVGSNKAERIYYIMYRKDGRQVHEKAGRQYKDDMTPARASGLRSARIESRQSTNREKREAEEAAKRAAENKWLIDRLWNEYKAGRKPGKGLVTDSGRYEKYLKKPFGDKEASEIASLDVERLKRRLLKTKSPQTVKHVLNLLTWITNFGVDQELCPGFTFNMKKMKKLTVNNQEPEKLTTAQLKKLLKAIDEDNHPQAGNMMKLALWSGMRRGEMFKLEWKHVNFETGFITLIDPKGGTDEKIPMNDMARKLLEGIKKGTPLSNKRSPYVFPGRNGGQRVDINKALSPIKKKANLPKRFRALQGLRHAFASMLASSGKVDLYTLQKLLTHKDPRMTQRYAHLRDEAVKRATSVTCDIMSAVSATDEKSKVIPLKKRTKK